MLKIIRWLGSWLAPQFGGGGGNNAGQIRAQQAAEDAQKQSVRDSINKLFGIAPRMATTQQAQTITVPESKSLQPTPGLDAWSGGGGNRMVVRPAHQETRMIDVTAPAYDPAEAKKNADAMESGYTDLAQRVRDYYLPQINQDRTVADRNLNFELARRGLNNSSEQLTQSNQISENYDKALRDVADTGLAAVNKARGDTEAARMNLMSSANNGMDQGTALTLAANQIRQAQLDAADYAKGRTIGDMAGNVALLNNTNQIGQGRLDAMRVYNRLFSPTAGQATGGYNGTKVG